MKIKYFENNQQYGIDYDWNLIVKCARKTPCQTGGATARHPLHSGRCTRKMDSRHVRT